MKKLKIVIIGGGSYIWAPNIVKDMLLKKTIQNAEFVLYDINPKASDLCGRFLNKIANQLGIEADIKSTHDRVSAFKGATHFVITISTGGLNAMSHDLAIPEKYGIYHTVGDTSGPGGWARTIRNFQIFADIARDINQYAPGAMVLNYTNTMPTLTDVLSRICTGPVVGLCHGLFENLYFIKEYYNVRDESEIAVKYAGVNHFFWITQAQVRNIDIIADLNRKLKKQSLSELLPQIHKDPAGYSSGRDVADELFRSTGVMPYIGDRHTCEFFPWYITSRRNMAKYRIKRTFIGERWRWFRKRENELQRMIRTKIKDSYLKPSCETAADIISAHTTGNAFVDVGNTVNTGQISNLPLGCVVETSVVVDKMGITPVNFGELPEQIASMIEPWTNTFTKTVDACFQNDKKLAIEALRLDPLCSALTFREVNELAEALLNAHKRFIPMFKL